MRLVRDESRTPPELIVQLEPGEKMDNAAADQLAVFIEAMTIYSDRNVRYKDNWRRYGWRGCLFRIRERAERAWDTLFNRDHLHDFPLEGDDTDDLIDLINLTAFAVRAVREGNRDGSGGWW